MNDVPFVENIRIDVGEQLKFTIMSVISPDGNRLGSPWIKENLSPWRKKPLWKIPKREVTMRSIEYIGSDWRDIDDNVNVVKWW